MHSKSNSLMTINQSTFVENYSYGRGSIVISEMDSSIINIYNSNFTKNYAINGGIMFS